ncbi:xanthine dehydrogenase family protein [Streptomyces sp. NA02950]|uniref:xanthine dehydrogenase family protein molybdopterin-binding subunit n=1 Tax=Streptomyces sp. NA02950 TaxID=2742137 RepID=UPI0015927FB4|nr:xanthine dehydrogenase family protein molybdopterin-binding subunit [Streptomyces sp. NA02950]QKV96469.1 xanthine dehydrogenase family protein [Streptomyces sp. NA02950]
MNAKPPFRDTGYGVGAGCPRLEDARHLAGHGRFLADVRLPGTREVAVVRSPVPHCRLRSVRAPDGVPGTDVWTATELAPLARQLIATAELPGFRAAPLPNLAVDTVRYVGEPIALAIGDSRAEAEDLARRITVDIEEFPAVVGHRAALADGATRVHREWPDNIYATTSGSIGDVDAAARRAAVSLTREYTVSRQSPLPLETRGVIAHYDRVDEQLVVWTSTQTPHMIRDTIADLLGLPGNRVRVIAPDIGGGFGAKCTVYPEEIALAAVATRLDHPVRWVEDRAEAMVATTQGRDHHYRLTGHAAADGELLALEADIVVDAGAYSVHPWTATMDASMTSAMLPGPYRVRNYRYTARSVATHTTPLGPCRGVARPAACFGIERLIDELAHELGIEPYAMRMRAMVGPEDMPYTSVASKVYDSGDYPEAVRRVSELIGHQGVRARQRATDPGSRTRLGVGYGSFTEQTAHGCLEWASRGLAVTFGVEGARLVMDATGSLTLSVGVQSQGQGHETTLAQVVGEVFDIAPDRIAVRHGDTAHMPRGDGTFASRSMVMAGGAAYGAAGLLAGRVRSIAAVLLDEPPGQLRFVRGSVVGHHGERTLTALAREFCRTPDHVPGVEGGLDVTYYYRPEVETGAFAYGTHAAVVRVDLDTGEVELLDYAVVEDCGTVVNPLIVDGQIIGGTVQGIGTALMEEIPHDTSGRPTATTLGGYPLPRAIDVPDIRVEHLRTPSPHTVLGMKGVGESGAIPPPAAIGNAITDALREFGARIDRTPMTAARVWAALDRASAPGPAPVDAGAGGRAGAR